MASKKDIGAIGEKLAAGYLKKRGYKIMASNFKCNFGEIDIIGYKNKTISFIEVKTRSSDEFGPPEEAVNKGKQKRQVRVAKYYLFKHKIAPEIPCQFDIVTIKLINNQPDINLIQNAFELPIT
ncbi:MAG: YraN family protein [Planctomycetota bacterium]